MTFVCGGLTCPHAESLYSCRTEVIDEAKRDDRELVIWRDGKVVKVKARDL